MCFNQEIWSLVPLLKIIDTRVISNFRSAVMAKNYLLIDAGANLKRSKGFKVSPKLNKANIEYQFAASDHMMAGKYYMIAANKQNAGDVTGKNSAVKSGAYYLNSCSKHLNNMNKYLYIYIGKSETGQTTQTSQTSQSSSDSNSISNTPSTTTTNSGSIIANSNTKVYHNTGCRYVSTIKPEHLTYFNNRQEAEANGYRACKVCGG